MTRQHPTEAQVQARVRLAIGLEPDLVLWRNQTGAYRDDRRYIRYGLCVGGSDLIGIGPMGFTAIELKAHRGRLSEPQQRFLKLVQDHGGWAGALRASSLGEAETKARWALQLMREGLGDWEGWPWV